MDPILEKLDELIAATRSHGIPLPNRWIDSEMAGVMLSCSGRHFRERIACRPDFPKPMRLDGVGHPRWLASEVMEWAKKQR